LRLQATLGSYRIPGLQAGTYKLRVAKPGLAVKMFDGFTMAVNRLRPLQFLPGREGQLGLRIEF
jgi:hypothetical protein